MTNEEYIKSKLDGHFFTFDLQRERIRTVKVPLDYIPEHRPAYLIDYENKNDNSHIWTPAEDDTIFTMRNEGMTWAVIAPAVKLAATTVLIRYEELCLLRGVQPLSNEVTRARRFPPDTERKVVEMRRSGMQFREIGPALGIKTNQARHIFIRWQRKQERMGLAA